MAQIITTYLKEHSFKFTLRELGVFLLLLFLNFKFLSILVFDNRLFAIDIIVYALFIITFNYSNWTYKKLIPTFLVIGIFTFINFSEFKLNVLTPLLLMQIISGISFRKYLWINFVITASTLIIMYLIFGLGKNLAGWTFLFDRQIRMTFGFNHPNVAALYYYCVFINGLLLLNFSRWKKYIPIYLIIIIPLWYFIYIKTGSRSYLLSLLMLYFTYFYYYFGVKFNKKNLFSISKYFISCSIIILSLTTLYFAFFKEDYTYIDKLLSGRLKLYNTFLNELNWSDSLFGSVAFRKVIIDSSYLHLMFEAGLIFFFCILIFYSYSVFKMIKQKAWIPICVIISFLIYGLMETLILYGMLIGCNIFWILLYYYYSNKMKL